MKGDAVNNIAAISGKRAEPRKCRTAGNSGKFYLFLKTAKTGPAQFLTKIIDGKPV
jgi:hypothetical protein